MKRVLFIAPQPFFQWRGSPIRVGFDVQAIAENGYDVTLLTLPIGEDRAIPGVTIERVANPLRVKNIPIGPSGHKAILDVLLLFRAVRLSCRRRYDIVHCVEETGVIGWLLRIFFRSRVVIEKHSDPASHRDKPFKNLVLALYMRIEHFAIRRADAIIATGPGLVDQAKAVAPHKPIHHIFDIPSSLVEPDEARSVAIRREWVKSPDDALILYVGSFAVYQGIDLMFDAMPAAIRAAPQSRFVVIGGTAEEIEARRGWLRGKGMEDRVVFAGKIPPDDLPHHLRAADVLLSPRLSGINTPLKLLDYLKSARAIVATDNSANRQILDESCAVLTAANPEAFAAGIAALVRDPARRETLGRAGRRKIDDLYNFSEFKRRLAECYRQLPE